MAIEVLSKVWKLDLKNCTEKLVLLALADNADEDTFDCFPSLNTIAKKCCMSVSGVRKVVAELVNEKLLFYRPGGGRNKNYFRLLIGDKVDPSTLGNSQCEGEGYTLGHVTHTLGETTKEPSLTVNEPSGAAKPQPPVNLEIKKPVKKEKPLSQREQEFLDAWRAAYLECRKVPYRLGGLSYQERAAIGRLMVSTDKPVKELIEWAKAAWRNSEKIFECKGSLTILGFETRFYDIMGKVKIDAAAVQAANAPAKKRFCDMTDEEKIKAGGLQYKDGTWGKPWGWKGD